MSQRGRGSYDHRLRDHARRTAVSSRERTFHRCPECHQFGVYAIQLPRTGTGLRCRYECENCGHGWE
jgi:DNA-directed RNA polymerase subunit M/transcription elongation factor TFIIS